VFAVGVAVVWVVVLIVHKPLGRGEKKKKKKSNEQAKKTVTVTYMN